MKVRIAYTEEVSDDFRRAINSYYGKPGLATRQEVRNWFILFGRSMDDDVMWELDNAERREERIKRDQEREEEETYA